MQEIWKDIVGYEGLYQVSNFGRVKSFRKGKEKLLKQHKSTTGYFRVGLRKDGMRQDWKVHRLVAIHFVPNKDGYPIINHIDGNKENNLPSNLEWCTQGWNVQHAYNIGLHKAANIPRGELTTLYVNERKSIPQIASIYGVSTITVWKRLKQYGIPTRTTAESNNKYKLPLDELLVDLKSGKKNAELAKKYKCTSALIATRKYQFKKKGVLNYE